MRILMMIEELGHEYYSKSDTSDVRTKQCRQRSESHGHI